MGIKTQSAIGTEGRRVDDILRLIDRVLEENDRAALAASAVRGKAASSNPMLQESHSSRVHEARVRKMLVRH